MNLSNLFFPIQAISTKTAPTKNFTQHFPYAFPRVSRCFSLPGGRLEEHSCQVAVLVGHACFLGMLTGDKAEMMGRRMMGEEVDINGLLYIYMYIYIIYVYIYICIYIYILYMYMYIYIGIYVYMSLYIRFIDRL